METLAPRRLAPPLAALALAMLAVVVGGLMAPHAAFFRAHATAWGAALLSLPALCLFVTRAGRRPLGHGWRLWWTAAWALVVIHLWWGLGRLHGWDVVSVFERQGLLIAVPIFVLEIVWLIDILLAWTRRDWQEARGWYLRWQWFAWAIAAANFFVSLMVFQNSGTSLVFGAIFSLALGLAILGRLATWEERR
jgi:hypothetical protein